MQFNITAISKLLSKRSKLILLIFTAVFFIVWLFPPQYLFFLKGLSSFLPLHILMETFSIIVAAMIFAVGWEAYLKEKSGNLIILSIVFLAVLFMDFAHMLSFAGMPPFVTPSNPEKAIFFWLCGRFFVAFAMLYIAINAWKPLRSYMTYYFVLAGTLVLVAIIYWLGLWHQEILPHTFTPGHGLTALKIYLECSVIAILAVAAISLTKKMLDKKQEYDSENIMMAIFLMILSEIFFMLYADVSDLYNFMGHVYKVVAYYYLYRAIFAENIEKPYRELEEANLMVSDLYNNAPCGYHSLDKDGTIVKINDTELSWLGYTRDEVIGKMRFADLLTSRSVETFKENFPVFLKRGWIKNLEFNLIRKDGTIFSVLVNATAIKDSDGNYIMSRSTVYDMANYRHSEGGPSQLSAIVESSDDAIIGKTLDNMIISWNHGAEKMYGYTAGEAIGRPISLIVPDENLNELNEIVARIKKGERVKHYETIRLTKDGRRVEVSVSLSPIFDDNGEIVAISAIARDITKQKQAERERLMHLQFVENMDKVNRAIQGANAPEQMMSDVLDAALSIFDCDRAYIVYPCDPNEATYHVPMERTRPEYPGALAKGLEIPIDPETIRVFRELMDSDDPVAFGPGSESALPPDLTKYFGVQSQIAMAIYPKVDKPYMFGLHQCSHARIWTHDEKQLLRDIGRRLSDALTSLLVLRNLRESEWKYREIFDNVIDALYLLEVTEDGRFRTIEVNPAMEKLTGIPRSQSVGKTQEEIVPEETARIVNAKYLHCVETGSPIEEEVELDLPAGKRYFHSTLIPARDENARIHRIVGISRDITDAKRAEKKLLESEQRYRGVFENSPVSIWEEDFSGVRSFFDDLRKDGVSDIESYFDQHPEAIQQCASLAKIVDVNRAAVTLHGAATKEELLAGMIRTFTRESFDAFRQELTCLWNGGTEMKRDAVVKTFAGEPRLVTVYFSVFPGYEQTLSRVLVSIVDITDLKQAEAELQEKDLHSQSLLRLSKNLELAQTYSEAINAASDEVREIIGYQNMWVFLFTEDKKHAYALVAGGDMSEDILSEKGAATLTIEGDKMLEEIAEARDIVIVEDARTDPRTDKEMVAKLGNRTIINLPIIFFDRHLGAIGTGTFGDEGIHLPSKTEEEYLRALASHLAVTIDRLHLLAEREKAKNELLKSRNLLGSIVETAPIRIFWKDRDLRYMGCNTEFAHDAGVSGPAEVVGKTDLDMVWVEQAESYRTDDMRIMESGTPKLNYEEIQTVSAGNTRYVITSKIPLLDENKHVIGILGVYQDITDRKKSEMEIIRMNRALRMLSSTNEALIRITDESLLLNEVCRIIVEIGGYHMTWVGYVEHDEAKTLRPMAHAGVDSGYIESAKISWGDNERGRGPGGVAIRTGQPSVVRNILSDPAFVPWRAAALQRGYQSIIALPLSSGGVTYGALGIYSSEADVFDTKEIEVLQELADDMAFGIMAIRARKERERIQVALNDAERIAHMGSWHMDLATNEVFWSKELYKLYGFDPALPPPLYTESMKLFTPQSWERLSTSIAKAVETGVSYELELETTAQRGGGNVWMLAIGELVRDANGAAIGVRGVVMDITERKQAEELLRTTKILLEQTIMQSPVPMVLVSMPDVIIRYINPAAFSFLGIDDGANIVGTPLLDIKPSWQDFDMQGKPGTLKELPLARSLQGSATEGEERYIIRKDGSIRYELVSATPIFDDNGQLIAGYLIMMDITERKQAEEALKHMNEKLEIKVNERTAQLESANKELEAFTYSVSHDLRAPLRAIDGFSAAVMEDYADKVGAEGKDYLQRVRNAVQKMSTLIDDLLSLSRLTRGELNKTSVNLSDIASEVAKTLRESEPNRDVELDIASNLLDEADPHFMEIVFTNLLNNAWKFTSKRDKAKIEFGLIQKDRKKVYYVRDNGAGFDMQYKNKLFQPFQRLHTVEDFPGTGVGLATVYRIINKHGGTIWAEGETEKGATFYFTLGG